MSNAIEFGFAHQSVTLAGTLYCPAAPPPWPVLVMLQGSGPADRDGDGFFVPIREDLIAAGIAVLSWDKQGIGGSAGDWRSQTLVDRADEASAALAWLRGQPSVDATRIGVWGHSQGGWVGPLVAAREPDIAVLVIHSGTGVTVEEQDYFGLEHTLRAGGAGEQEVAQGHDFMRALHAAAVSATPFDQVRAEIIEPAMGHPWLNYFGPLDPEEWHFLVLNLSQPLDPLWALRRVRCPALAVFGERDVLIPVDRSIRILKETFTGPELRIHVFPGANHRLQVGDPPHFAPGYFAITTGWIARHIGASHS